MNDKEIKKLLNKYTHINEILKKAGIVRTGKVVADYGEYVVSKKLNLKLVGTSMNKGYDAVDAGGKRYEVKTRKATAWNKSTLFPVSPTQLSTIDFLIYIEFDNRWNLVKLLKIPAKKLMVNKYNRVQVSQDLVKKFSIL
jgi:hypothetical protein